MLSEKLQNDTRGAVYPVHCQMTLDTRNQDALRINVYTDLKLFEHWRRGTQTTSISQTICLMHQRGSNRVRGIKIILFPSIRSHY